MQTFVGVFITLFITTCVSQPLMQQVPVQNAASRLAVANDGSPAMYYFLPGMTNNLWVLALEGGWWCYNEVTCQQRWAGDAALMSSKFRPATAKPSSFWDPSCDANPFCLGNMVFMPYLYSDGYMGNYSAAESNTSFQFRGRPSLIAIVEDLFKGFTLNNVTYRIPQGSKFVFTGFSAGAFGALMNTNYIGDLVKTLCPTCSFYSIPDSGLFIGLANDTIQPTSACDVNVQSCPYRMEIEIAAKTWGSAPFLDPTCTAAMAVLKQPSWYCMFGDVLIQYVRQDIFIVQYMFDAAELLADGALNVLNTTQLSFAVELAEEKKILFKKFPSFLPACLGHCMATVPALQHLTINGMAMKNAINLWFVGGSKTSYIDSCVTPECRKGCV